MVHADLLVLGALGLRSAPVAARRSLSGLACSSPLLRRVLKPSLQICSSAVRMDSCASFLLPVCFLQVWIAMTAVYRLQMMSTYSLSLPPPLRVSRRLTRILVCLVRILMCFMSDHYQSPHPPSGRRGALPRIARPLVRSYPSHHTLTTGGAGRRAPVRPTRAPRRATPDAWPPTSPGVLYWMHWPRIL